MIWCGHRRREQQCRIVSAIICTHTQFNENPYSYPVVPTGAWIADAGTRADPDGVGASGYCADGFPKLSFLLALSRLSRAASGIGVNRGYSGCTSPTLSRTQPVRVQTCHQLPFFRFRRCGVRRGGHFKARCSVRVSPAPDCWNTCVHFKPPLADSVCLSSPGYVARDSERDRDVE